MPYGVQESCVVYDKYTCYVRVEGGISSMPTNQPKVPKGASGSCRLNLGAKLMWLGDITSRNSTIQK